MDKPKEIKITNNEPNYKKIYPGLNLEGKCTNENCQANGIFVWAKLDSRYGNMNLNTLIYNCPCPLCGRNLKKISSCGFYKCEFQYDGKRVGKEKEISGFIKATSKDTYTYHHGAIYIYWHYINFEVKELSVSSKKKQYGHLDKINEAPKKHSTGTNRISHKGANNFYEESSKGKQVNDPSSNKEQFGKAPKVINKRNSTKGGNDFYIEEKESTIKDNSMLKKEDTMIDFPLYTDLKYIIVGIKEYYGGRLKGLSGCENDANIMEKILREKGFNGKKLLNQIATKSKLIEELGKLKNYSDANSMIVFFYSGHGYKGGIETFDEKLRYQDIIDIIKHIKCQNFLFILDCCHSGSIFDIKIPSTINTDITSKGSDRNVFYGLSLPEIDLLRNVTIKNTIWALVAGTKTEVVYNQNQRGMFCKGLSEILDKESVSWENKKWIDLSDVNKLFENVNTEGRVPLYGCLRSDSNIDSFKGMPVFLKNKESSILKVSEKQIHQIFKCSLSHNFVTLEDLKPCLIHYLKENNHFYSDSRFNNHFIKEGANILGKCTNKFCVGKENLWISLGFDIYDCCKKELRCSLCRLKVVTVIPIDLVFFRCSFKMNGKNSKGETINEKAITYSPDRRKFDCDWDYLTIETKKN
eukprot:TRINITY_DN7798_c0_g3_i1.p1 TRINITY_DN7798_c0_g3~~TRINITY_DN7798_c0_g3_i1.p1  ORF type:complete len:657 (-),score=106.43 TRINITY_DN7798_c0_g3_i1:27-1940(-)